VPPKNNYRLTMELLSTFEYDVVREQKSKAVSCLDFYELAGASGLGCRLTEIEIPGAREVGASQRQAKEVLCENR
jgi:hypothetical protein